MVKIAKLAKVAASERFYPYDTFTELGTYTDVFTEKSCRM